MTKSERDKLIDELEREPEVVVRGTGVKINYRWKNNCYNEADNTPIEEALDRDTQDHWTMPEDKETKAGYGIFNFDWLMRPFRAAVLWHDKVTTKGSAAQKAGIPNWRINRAWRDMLDGMYRTQKGSGIIKRTAWLAGFFVAKVNRFFYEGSIKGKEKVTQDKDSGEMF